MKQKGKPKQIQKIQQPRRLRLFALVSPLGDGRGGCWALVLTNYYLNIKSNPFLDEVLAAINISDFCL
jgi:hypothetical protein